MSTNITTLRNASPVAARFGSNFGYRFEGDNVTLQANVQLVHFFEQEVQWLLQLQASQVGDTAGKTPFTHVIAEVVLPPLVELTSSTDACSLTTIAVPPAGQGEFNLSLALISRQADQVDELHDIVNFSRPECFVQPRLVGPLGCSFAQNELTLSIDRIENPRDIANVSGTLSLELWALTEPYAGGTFQGLPLAGAILGRLSGQEGWSNAVYSLHYAPPTPGLWQVTVMLREWTGAGYTTRDFRNLAEPLVISTEPVAAPAKPVSVKPEEVPAAAPAPKPVVKATIPAAAIKPTKAAKETKPAKTGSATKKSGPSARAPKSSK